MGNPPAWVVKEPFDPPGVERVLPCRFGLAMVDAGRSKKVFLYHDTICWDILAVPGAILAPGAIFARQSPFVGYVTYASAQV
jgi:hypothetical protein